MSSPAELMSNAFVSAWLFIGAVFAYLCVWGYEASLDKLFRSIEFGCNDFCYLVEFSSSAGTNISLNVDDEQ